MMILLILFVLSTVAMAAIPLRYVPRLHRSLPEDFASGDGAPNSIARVHIVGYINRLETWFHHSAKNSLLKMLDRILGIFERGAGKVAGRTKSTRILIQEKFRVIPRESLYWRQIRVWKKTNGVQKTKITHEPDGYDISNHSHERS